MEKGWSSAPPQWAASEHSFVPWVPAAKRAVPPKPNDADRYLHRVPGYPWPVTAPCGARRREGFRVAGPLEQPDCPNCLTVQGTPAGLIKRGWLPEMTGDDLNDLPRAWGFYDVPDSIGRHVVLAVPTPSSRPHCPACGTHGDAEIRTAESGDPVAPYVTFPKCGHAWAIVRELAPAPE